VRRRIGLGETSGEVLAEPLGVGNRDVDSPRNRDLIPLGPGVGHVLVEFRDENLLPVACTGSVPFSSLSLTPCASESAIKIRPLSKLVVPRGYTRLHCGQEVGASRGRRALPPS